MIPCMDNESYRWPTMKQCLFLKPINVFNKNPLKINKFAVHAMHNKCYIFFLYACFTLFGIDINNKIRKSKPCALMVFNLMFMCQMCWLELEGLVVRADDQWDIWVSLVKTWMSSNGHDENSTNKHHIRSFFWCNVHWNCYCLWTLANKV